MSFLDKAIILAAEVHEGQKDKSGQPYILHPITVMMSLETILERTVAVLHDVIEDSHYSYQDLITMGFPKFIADAVVAVSRRGWETNKEYYSRIKENPIAVKVKIKDLEHNMDVTRFERRMSKDDVNRLKIYHNRWLELRKVDSE